MSAPPSTSRPARAGRWLLGITLLTPLLYVLMAPGALLNLAVPMSLFLAAHLLLEVGSVVACLLVGSTAWFVAESQRRGANRLLAAGFLLVALLDLTHLAAYAGMPDLVSPNTPHKAIVLWLLARYTAALTLVAWCGPRSAPRAGGVAPLLGGAVIVALALLALWHPEVLPSTFTPGVGLTRLKQVLEGGVVALMLWALLGQTRRMRTLTPEDRADEAPVRDSLVLMVLAELFFVLYSQRVTDSANLLGHVYKIGAYACLAHGLFLNRVRRPFRRLAEAHQALAQSSAEYRDLLERAPQGVVIADEAGVIRMVNRALEAMFGYSRDMLVGQPLDMLLAPEQREGCRRHMQRWLAAPERPAMQGRMGLRGAHHDGHHFEIDVALGTAQFGRTRMRTAHVTDISLQRAHENALEHRATHDLLTGLPNRSHFVTLLHRAVAQGPAVTGGVIGATILDLDEFKAVNDCHGSEAGDTLLREVARRLCGHLRKGDHVARLGSDEFALLLHRESADALEREVRRLVAAAQPDVDIGTLTWPISISTGTAVFPLDAGDADRLLRCADLALHEAKRSGRGGNTRFDAELGEHLQRELRVHARLQAALQAGALHLHYQPQVDVGSGTMLGFEALLRWNDTELGTVSPALFVPVAERTGLIGSLGDFVLDAACRQLRTWQDQGLGAHVSINLSPRQFRQPDLALRLAGALASHGVPASSLAVEITESAMMDDPQAAAAQLRAIAELGIGVELDDFGTGHSSLAWLKTFPISIIKIDRSFVRDMVHDANDAAIVRAIVVLAHTLGCRVIAEGVEQPEQLERLRHLGCDHYQGWLFSRAVAPAQATAMLQQARAPGRDAAVPQSDYAGL